MKNDLLNRTAAIENIMSQPSSNKSKTARSLQQFSGLPLSDLSPDIRNKLESELLKVNQIMSHYDINTVDDFGKITRIDLKKLVMIICTLCKDLNKMVITEVI